MSPTVSVIIPCFNTSHYLEEAVNSVLSQTYTDIECIIVDDGSTDNTCQVSKSLAEKDSRVKYLFKENGGAASARNFGIRHAAGRWIQLLDADDLVNENKIKSQLGMIDRNETLSRVVLYSDYEVFWEDERRNVIKREAITVGSLNKQQLLERVMSGGFKANLPIHANNTLFSREVFNGKMFNENLMGYEDMDLWVDLLMSRNIAFIYTPICGMYYRIHHSNMTKDHSFMRHAYIYFLKEVCKKDKALLKLTPHVGRLTFLGMKTKDKKLVARLMELIYLADAPVYIDSKRKIDIGPLLSKFYRTKLLFPLAALWYRFKRLWKRIVSF